MGYTTKEIIDIAIGMEEAGFAFYTKVAEKFDDAGVKGTFSFLADEEVKHKKTFQSMISDSENKPGNFNEEYYQYLKAIGGGMVYPQKKMTLDEIMNTIKTPTDAIVKAFQDEKEAILFYTEIKKLYKNDDNISKILEEIIEEERKHAVKLWEIQESLKQ